jgi:hypothetical protein
MRRNHSVLRACPTCGAAFTVAPSHIRGGGGKFCSHPCYVIARRAGGVDRFWAKVRKSDGCWVWSRAHLPKGYGLVVRGIGGADERLTHRVAWVLASGEPIPEGFDVLHTCDNPPCVRNDEAGIYEINGIVRPRFGHLWLGTVRDNGIDMASKGRATAPHAKLTPEVVREIRQRHDAGGVTMTALATEHGVSVHTLSDAIHGRTWRRA